MKRLSAFLIATISFLILASTVSAQYGQYGPYGGNEPSLSIVVDKMVGKPTMTKGGQTDADYVDNLSPSDTRFQPGSEVLFKVKVRNTSDSKLTNITVTDMLPEYVEQVAGKGAFNPESREIVIAAGDFEPDEEKEYIITVKVFAQDKLPADKGLMCLVNKAQAGNDQVSDEDTAQFCVEKEVLGVTSVPSAGPEMGLVLISGQIAALGLGMYLKKKTS